MRKITFLLTLLLMYVGVTPMMATLVQFSVDTNKAYTIKTNGTYKYYLFQNNGSIIRSSVSASSAQPEDEAYYFRFVEVGKTTVYGSQTYTQYYIQPVTDPSSYVYNNAGSVGYSNSATESKKVWFVLHDDENNCQCIMFANYGNSSSNYWYTPGTTDIQLGGPTSTYIWPNMNGLIIEEVLGYEIVDEALLAQARSEFDAAYASAQAIIEEANLNIVKTELPLQVTNENNSYYLWTNAQEPSEGPIKNLIDNNVNTFFHTQWSEPVPAGPHYIEIDLGTGNALSEFLFGYNTRIYDGGADYPSAMNILGSNDKVNYDVITTLTGLPTSPGKRYDSNSIKSETAYRYIRFSVTETYQKNRTYWHMSEFEMFTNNISVADKYISVKNDVYNLKSLFDSHSNNASYNIAKLNEATAALNAAVQAIKAGAGFTYTLTVGSAGYATLFLDYNAAIPENLEAYTVTEVNDGYAKLNLVEGVLPANTGVIVKASAANYSFDASTEEPTAVTGNLLKGSVANDYVEGAAYVLGILDGNVGLYSAKLNKNATGGDGNTHFLNNAYKAYLPASALTSNANMLRFDFSGETTGVEEVEVESTAKTIYDLSGRKVSGMSAPGLYIVNGKKVLVK